MQKHFEIYARRAKTYQRLVAREDKDGLLLPAILEVAPPAPLDVVELGAGTGRLTCLLAPEASRIAAFDLSPSMLAVARGRLEAMGAKRWVLAMADHRALPVADSSADLVVAGWTVFHAAEPFTDGGEAVAAVVGEISRVLRPGGCAVLIESLGTGETSPSPPTDIVAYLDALETVHGFEKRWVRTDYRFESPEEAEELVRFFFGEELAARVRAEGAVELPECTGLWHRAFGGAGVS